jgi:hypothetical protein
VLVNFRRIFNVGNIYVSFSSQKGLSRKKTSSKLVCVRALQPFLVTFDFRITMLPTEKGKNYVAETLLIFRLFYMLENISSFFFPKPIIILNERVQKVRPKLKR